MKRMKVLILSGSIIMLGISLSNSFITKGSENDRKILLNYSSDNIDIDSKYSLVTKFDNENNIRLNKTESINYIDEVLKKSKDYKEKLGIRYDDVLLLAKLIYSEAGDEPNKGKLAVGEVVINRMNKLGKSLEDIIFEKNQFDGVKTHWFKEDPPIECINAATEVLNGQSSVLNSNTVLFANLKLCNPEWAKLDKFVTRIGDHWFFIE